VAKARVRLGERMAAFRMPVNCDPLRSLGGRFDSPLDSAREETTVRRTERCGVARVKKPT